MATGGGITAAGQVVSNDSGGVHAFIGNGSSVALATVSAGTVLLRPNGAASTTNQATYNSSGNFAIAGTGTAVNWSATSDGRLKEAVEYVRPNIDIAKAIAKNYVHFDWKKDKRADRGLIAQDVQKFAPQHVYEDEDGTLSVDKASLALEAIAAFMAHMGD